jgi:hypothetical protein
MDMVEQLDETGKVGRSLNFMAVIPEESFVVSIGRGSKSMAKISPSSA